MAGPPADQTTDSRFGKFILHRRLGTGAMAEVYLAEMVGPSGFSKMVALKRLHPHLADNDEFIDSFISEARLGGSLEHPNIVQTIELGREGDVYYLAMELVQGTTLRKIIRAHQKAWVPLPLGAALEVMRQLAIGLGYAHSATNARGQALNLIHRDLKPGNVLINQFGQAKITDWGVAKSAANVRETINGNMLKGTISYMSPEQAACRDLDGRSDLYALGAILFEMTTGERLYPGDIGVQGIYQIIQGDIAPRLALLRVLPGEVEAIIRRLLQTERDKRYPTAAALLEDLRPILRANGATPAALAEVVKGVSALKGGGTSASLGAPLSEQRRPPNLRMALRTQDIPSIQQNLLVDVEMPGEVPSSPSTRGELTLDRRSRDSGERAVPLHARGSSQGGTESRFKTTHRIPVSGQQGAGLDPASRSEAAPEVTRTGPYAFVSGPGSSIAAPSSMASPRPPAQVQAPPAKGRRLWVALAFPLLLIIGGGIGAGIWAYNRPAATPPLVVVRGGSQPAPKAVAQSSAGDIDRLGQPSGSGAAALPPSGDGPGDSADLSSAFKEAEAPPASGVAPDAGRIDAPSEAPAPPPEVAPPPLKRAAPKPAPAQPAPPPVSRVAAVSKAPEGFLTLNARPWAWAYVDGKRLDKPTPLMREPIPSGTHTLVLETEDGRRHGPVTITVEPGQSLQMRPVIF